jgi:hypothetical protein
MTQVHRLTGHNQIPAVADDGQAVRWLFGDVRTGIVGEAI